MIADMPVKGTLSSLPVRLTYSAVCITVAVLLALGVNRANADIGDSDRLGFFPDSVEWITRNLVEGTPIPVCSEHYPKATRMAADRWNAALGITAFRMLQAGVGCYDIEIPEDGWDPQKGVVRLVVSQGTDPRKSTCPAGETIVPCMKYRGSFAGVYPDSYDGPRGYGQPIGCELYRDEEDEMGKVKQSMDRAALGCIMFDHQGFHDDDWLDNRELRTYYGRAEIFLHPRHHPRANDGTDSKSAELIRDIAHEMGHALGLADYYCGGGGNDGLERDGEPENRSLMNSWTVNRECNSLDDAPTARDLRDYTTVYTPATVTNPDSAARAEPLTTHSG